VLPTLTLADAGLTVTEATGTSATVIAAVPLWPSLVAVIVAEPVTTAVTRPLASTVATAVLLLDHVTTRPVSVLPVESLVTAEVAAFHQPRWWRTLGSRPRSPPAGS